MSSPADRRYTKTHEWVQLEGNVATIGLTDHAQQELGDITFVELPDEGAALAQHQPFGVVESVKAAADVYAPVDGEVIERNEAVVEQPEMVNTAPYEGAWLLKIRVEDPSQIEELMDATAYDAHAATV